jgi:RNA polymerase sigma factor (sigma-70 family)
MAWQDKFSGSATRINAEYEQELRLADQARMGADWALGALIARYQPTVTRYLTRLTGNPSRAQALAEQIFLRMERRLHGPHGAQHLRLWLLRACTESGLDEVRKPRLTTPRAQLESSHPRALLPEMPNQQKGENPTGRADRLRAGLGALAVRTGSTRRQLRHLIWSSPESNRYSAAATARPETIQSTGIWDSASARTYGTFAGSEEEILTPREALRYRMVRAVLAELPYGDAQCLALHLIANLNQAEVARALGITSSATRRRIVEGLQLFAQRYEAATASLGLSLDFDTLEDDRTEQTAGGRGEVLEPSAPAGNPDRRPSFPAQREPVVVSARLDPPPSPVEANEESTIIWDLPPFAAVTAPFSPTIAAEVDEAAAEVTRRLVWSRPAANRRTPVTSGDEVTTRLIRPIPAEPENAPPPVIPEREVEIITTPPPEALVVDADKSGSEESSEAEPWLLQAAPRMVPILTPDVAVANIGSSLETGSEQDIEREQPVPLGSSVSRDTGAALREVRVVSVLTQEVPDDDRLVVGGSAGGEQYQRPAHHSSSAP